MFGIRSRVWTHCTNSMFCAQALDEHALGDEQAEDRGRRPDQADQDPSMRNGTRMNQFVAPTRRMIPISRLRAATAIRIVLPMRTPPR